MEPRTRTDKVKISDSQTVDDAGAKMSCGAYLGSTDSQLVVDAGHACFVTVGDTVVINATTSLIPPGCTLQWQEDAANPGLVTLTARESLTPTVILPKAGAYRLRLVASCVDGRQGVDEVLVYGFDKPLPSYPDQTFMYHPEGGVGDSIRAGDGREYVFDPLAHGIQEAVMEAWIDIKGGRFQMTPGVDGRFHKAVHGAAQQEPHWFWAFVGANRYAETPLVTVSVTEGATADSWRIEASTPLANSFGAPACNFQLLPDSASEDAIISTTGGGMFEVSGRFAEPRKFYMVAENMKYRSLPRLITLPVKPKTAHLPRLGVIYQIFVKHFADANGDGRGDLQGLMNKLDYLADDLGVNTLLLMPIFQTPGPVSWGYSPADLGSVHPDYGTMEDLARLFKEAAARKLKVLLDVPVNHVDKTFPPCNEALANPLSPSSGWFYFFDNNQKWFGWDFRDDGSQSHFYAMQQSNDVAVNLDNPYARENIIGHIARLLNLNRDGSAGDSMAGLRLDYIKGPSKDFWSELAAAARTVNPEVALVGEAWSGPHDLGVYLREAGLNGVFDFPFQYALRGALEHGDAGHLYWHFDEVIRHYGDEGIPVSFVSNHDVNRLVKDLDGDNAGMVRAAATIVLTAPGSPMIFFGDELGMLAQDDWDPERKNGGAYPWGGDDPYQADEPWGDPLLKPLSLAEQKADEKSLFAHHKKLLELRRELNALHDERSRGWHYRSQDLDDNAIYALFRQSGSNRVLVIVNLSSDWRQVRFEEKVRSTRKYAQNLGLSDDWLGPWGTVIYRLPDG